MANFAYDYSRYSSSKKLRLFALVGLGLPKVGMHCFSFRTSIDSTLRCFAAGFGAIIPCSYSLLRSDGGLWLIFLITLVRVAYCMAI